MKTTTLLAASLLVTSATACTKRPIFQNTSGPVSVPSTWHQLPEDAPSESKPEIEPEQNPADQEKLSQSLDRILLADKKTIENIPPTASTKKYTQSELPRNWTPWHLEFLVTDLALSAQGTMGVLTVKGSPVVQVYWRKKRPAPQPLPTPAPTQDPPTFSSAQYNGGISKEELAAQIEPSVQAAIATGKIKDGPVLRNSLNQTATQFQELVWALESQPGSQWWISGFRIDFSVGASGHVAGIGTVGGEVRLRYEWKRMRRLSPTPGTLATKTPVQLKSTLASNLIRFVSAMQTDLAKAAETGLSDKGYQGYTFRIGIGVSAKGDIGIAKGNTSLIGHVNFSRDVQKPSLTYPAPKPTEGFLSSVETYQEPILLIDTAPKPSHLTYAAANHINYEMKESDQGDPLEVIYKIDRERLQKGLAKAMGMAEFFADRGSSVPSTGNWNIFQIKTGIDFSISGSVGLVTIGGTIAHRISFYNQGF